MLPETEQIADFGRTAGTESVADNRQTELTETEGTTESGGSQPDNHEEKSYDEIVEAINILLTDGAAEFYDRYPVDESFFQWLEGKQNSLLTIVISADCSSSKISSEIHDAIPPLRLANSIVYHVGSRLISPTKSIVIFLSCAASFHVTLSSR